MAAVHAGLEFLCSGLDTEGATPTDRTERLWSVGGKAIKVISSDL